MGVLNYCHGCVRSGSCVSTLLVVVRSFTWLLLLLRLLLMMMTLMMLLFLPVPLRCFRQWPPLG